MYLLAYALCYTSLSFAPSMNNIYTRYRTISSNGWDGVLLIKPGGIFSGAPKSRLPVASTASSKGSSQGNAKC